MCRRALAPLFSSCFPALQDVKQYFPITCCPKEADFVGTSIAIGFESKLWAAADALRYNMDAAEYKHGVLGLIFLKYISDAFEAKHTELESQQAQRADPEDPDECRGEDPTGGGAPLQGRRRCDHHES